MKAGMILPENALVAPSHCIADLPAIHGNPLQIDNAHSDLGCIPENGAFVGRREIALISLDPESRRKAERIVGGIFTIHELPVPPKVRFI